MNSSSGRLSKLACNSTYKFVKGNEILFQISPILFNFLELCFKFRLHFDTANEVNWGISSRILGTVLLLMCSYWARSPDVMNTGGSSNGIWRFWRRFWWLLTSDAMNFCCLYQILEQNEISSASRCLPDRKTLETFCRFSEIATLPNYSPEGHHLCWNVTGNANSFGLWVFDTHLFKSAFPQLLQPVIILTGNLELMAPSAAIGVEAAILLHLIMQLLWHAQFDNHIVVSSNLYIGWWVAEHNLAKEACTASTKGEKPLQRWALYAKIESSRSKWVYKRNA